MDNFTIFDMLYDNYKIVKPVRLIECFAGYGSQALSLKYLGVKFEHHKICEWATKSIQAYKDNHFTNDNTDYSKDLTQEQVVDFLFKKGVSMNYNEPMSFDQIKRKGEEWQRTTYNNIIATHNLVNISQVKGKDLEITDTDKYDYILTYSFPCQDLSLAGKRAGMEKDSGTRSGLLWEVERILEECKQEGALPRILLMENVPEVVGTGNIEHFKKWREKLEQLGYSNYDKILNAKDYGIPQNRRRCFMISILGEYNYSFPSSIPLKIRLKDLLEKNVEEKFYLSTDKLQRIQSWGGYEDPLKDTSRDRVCSTITTHVGKDSNGMQLVEEESILIKEATKKGFKEAYEGDGIDIGGRMESHRGTVQRGMAQTLKTSGDEVGVVVVGNYSPSNHNAARVVDQEGLAPTVMENHGTVTAVVDKDYSEYSKIKIMKNIVSGDVCGTITANAMQSINHDNCHLIVEEENLKTKLCNDLIASGKVKENDVIRHSYSTSRMKEWEKRYINSEIVDKFEEGQMATTTFPNGYGHGPRTHNESIALNTIDKPVVKQQLRIRKLTPREALRLMGVKDEDITNMSKNQSDASLWHLAGDSIVTTPLIAMLSQFFDIDWRDKLWWH